MAELRQVRVQVLDHKTGQVIENVNTKTSTSAVYLPDGTTLASYLDNLDVQVTEFQKKLAQHLAQQHVDPEKIASLLVGAPTYDKNTGTFTYTTYDGNVKELDTLLEKIPVDFKLREEEVPVDPEDESAGTVTKNYLVMIADDKTEQKLDVTKLLNICKGSNGEQIIVAVDTDGTIKASVVPESIKLADLAQEVIDAIGEQYTLTAATTTALGGVIVGDGLSVDAAGKIAAANVKYGDDAVALKFTEEANTAVVTVTGPADTLVETTVGTAVSAQTVTAEITGDAAGSATATYQWYKRTIGVDVAFVTVAGATAATLSGGDIDVSAEGTTVYYCCVGATGESVVADPVASSRVTIVVNPAPVVEGE